MSILAKAERDVKRQERIAVELDAIESRGGGNGAKPPVTVIPTPPSGHEFMAKKFPPRKKVLGPFTTSALVHAAGDSGVGKTMVATAISNALSTGSGLFNWQGYEPVDVLHVDGEMPGDMLQERIQLFEWGAGVSIGCNCYPSPTIAPSTVSKLSTWPTHFGRNASFTSPMMWTWCSSITSFHWCPSQA